MKHRIYLGSLAALACLALGLSTGCGSSSSSSGGGTTTPPPLAVNTYVFYASGQEAINEGINYYAIAGAVTIDADGNVTGGEQDYNDAFGFTFTDTISAGSAALVLDSTGNGTLTLNTGDTNLGVSGVETFAVQFANANHALIIQFDGSATSSGSLDLQTVTTPANGNYAFSVVGIDNTGPANYDSIAVGGVVAISSGTSLTGTYDINDANTGELTTGNAITAATLSSTDSFGRGTITGLPFATTVAFYTVGPAAGSQAMRLIDIDPDDTAVGSAFGQGSATFDDTSFATAGAGSVFNLLGQWAEIYGSVGQFSTDSNGNITAGVADDNELDNGIQQTASSIVDSTYDLVDSGINGYGWMNLTGNGDVSYLGLYMVDPALNINDPNNTSTDLGGALILDLDAALPGGVGVITPQTDTTSTDFTGTYVAGFQNFNDFGDCGDCELDMVSVGSMSAGALSLTASDSDPFDTISGLESTGDPYTSSPVADLVNVGLFESSPLDATIGGDAGAFATVDIYQASGTTLYWIELDSDSAFVGPMIQQGSVDSLPATRGKPAAKTVKKVNPATLTKGVGGPVR